MNYENAKRLNGGRSLTLLVSLLVILGMGVSGTLAYLFVLSDRLSNSFQPAEVKSQVVENFNGTTKSNVKIQNTGNIYAWIRVALVPTWEDGSGNAVNRKVLPSDLTVTFSGSGWFAGSDGYYYCTDKIAPGGLTPVLLNRVIVNVTNDKGYRLDYQVLCEAIQAEPEAAITEVWGSAVTVQGEHLTRLGG